jgi:long-chain acyl-CoA synthetase
MTTAKREKTVRIRERLAGRRLLVTGVTGLLAKVFVEKLLRSAPEVGRIYLLVRAREDGTSSQERLEREVLASSVFDRLRAKLGPAFDRLCEEKIKVITGDLTKDQLGLSEADAQLLKRELDIIVNSAATVTFDERLDLAMNLNVKGPGRLLAFARACKHAAVMQVSTCYVSGCRSGDIPEEITGPPSGRPIDVDALIREMEDECEDIIASPTEEGESGRRRLIEAGMQFARRHGWNDTYTLTKWMGEQIVDRNRGKVPVVVLRPAIIESSYEEPVPGWIDGLRMADPMIIAFGRGKLTDFPADGGASIDVIPVDHVANAMIAALPLPSDDPGLRVYQVGSSARRPMVCGQLIGHLAEGFRRRPMFDVDGRPVKLSKFRLIGQVEFDQKWRRRLTRAVKYQKKLGRSNAGRKRRRQVASAIARIEQLLYFSRIYSPYTHLHCRFLDDRLCELMASLHPDDREAFPVILPESAWPDYVMNRHLPGLRRFVLAGGRGTDRPLPPAPDVNPDDSKIREAVAGAESIFEAFAGAAELCGEKIALQMRRAGRWICYTYAEALAATASIAQRFSELGLSSGDRVVICGENGPEWALAYLAAMRSGLTAVPLDPQLDGEEIVGCARFAKAKLICAGRTTIDAITSATALEQHGRNGLLPVILIAEPFVPPAGASRDALLPPADVSGDAIASILFTSGTTVSPKAVPLTHANFLSNARAIREVQPHDARDSFLCVLPMYHAFAFTTGFIVPLTAGAAIAFVEQLKTQEILETMHVSKTTVMLAVPRLLKLFHDAIEARVQSSGVMVRSVIRACGFLSELSGRRLGRLLFATVHRRFGGHLRLFVSGGSALDPELFHAFGRMGFTVAEGYGLTETAPVLTVNAVGACKAGSAGKALPGVELEIRDANAQGVGELWVRGPNVMRGYLDNPKATGEVMRDQWFRTGDLCRFDSEGYIYIVGRANDTIVTDAGKNVHPDEVEVRYRDLAYVKELCVVGVPTARGTSESVHAVVVPDFERASDLDRSSLERTIREEIAIIGESLPSHQRIAMVHFWRNELPKTTTLKAKRREIRDRILAEDHTSPPAAREVAKGAPVSAAKAKADRPTGTSYIYQLLARLSHKPESDIHPQSNLLLDLGIDSLMKLYIIADVESHFDFTCDDEAAAGLSRVKDLVALVGDRPFVGETAQSERSWRSWLHRSDGRAESATRTSQPDATLLPLAPVRWAARGGLSLLFKSYVRVRSEGVRNIPASGPFILAANHTSHLDAGSVLTAVGGRRHVWVAAAQDYFYNTAMKRWVLERLFDAIPFDRNSDGIRGLRQCIDTLLRGDGLLFLPEGTRSITGRIQPFKLGVAIMAVEARAPVVPTRIEHAFELMPKGRMMARPGVVKVTFGEPLSPEDWSSPDDLNKQYDLYREMTREIQTRVEALGDGRGGGPSRPRGRSVGSMVAGGGS